MIKKHKNNKKIAYLICISEIINYSTIRLNYKQSNSYIYFYQQQNKRMQVCSLKELLRDLGEYLRMGHIKLALS